MPGQATLVDLVVKFSPTNTTATLNIRTVLTTETANFPAHFVTDPMTNESAHVFTFFTFMTIIALTSVLSAGKASYSHRALTNICEYTVVKDLTNVLTVSGLSRLLLFSALMYAFIVEKNHSCANTAGALSPHTRHTIVTCDANIIYYKIFIYL